LRRPIKEVYEKKMKAKTKKQHWTRDDTEFTILALPTTFWYILFCYLPMFGVIIAFKDFRINGGFIHSLATSAWAGFSNFTFLFKNPDTWMIVRNTLLYNAVFIVLGIVIPVALALMLTELWSKRTAKVIQTLMFFPYFLSWVVVAALVYAFLSPANGVVNGIITSLGGEPVNWYQDAKFWPGFLVFMSQWKGMGYGMVLYMATITGLDKSVYEAAVIDGATKWQQVWRLTIPMMKTIIVLQFIMAAGHIFNSDFGLFYQVPRNQNALYNVTTTIDVYTYKLLFQGSATIGMSAAAALLQSVLACLCTLGVNAIVNKIDPDSAMI
jgi:putative aldouronate transport system permease protein